MLISGVYLKISSVKYEYYDQHMINNQHFEGGGEVHRVMKNQKTHFLYILSGIL